MEVPINLHTFLNFFWPYRPPPPPPGNSNPLCGGVSIFSGTAQLSDGAMVQFECDYNNNNNDNNDNDNNRDFAC